MFIEKANVTGALYSSVEASLHCHHQLIRIQVSFLRRFSLKFKHILFAQMCKKDKAQVKQTYGVFSYIQ